MIFPALLDFVKDRQMRRNGHATALYFELMLRPNSSQEPITVKAWVFAQILGMHRQHVAQALDLLIREGYLHDCGREHQKAPRRVTVAIERRMTPKPCIADRRVA